MKPVEQPQGMITSGPFLTPRHLRMKSVPAEPATNWARPSWAGGICWEGAPAVEGLPQDPRGHTHTHTPPTTMMIKTLWSPLPESAPSFQFSRINKARATPKVGKEVQELHSEKSRNTHLTAGSILLVSSWAGATPFPSSMSPPTSSHKSSQDTAQGHTYSLHSMDNCRTTSNSQHLVILKKRGRKAQNLLIPCPTPSSAHP